LILLDLRHTAAWDSVMKRVVVLAMFGSIVFAQAASGQVAPAPPAAAPGASTAGQSIILERVLVRVNGEIFTQSELVRHQIDMIRAKNIDTQNITDANVLKLMNDVTPDVLVDAVDEMLLIQRAKDLGLKFTDEEFKLGIDNIKKENKLDDATLKQALAREGLTMDDLRQNFEREALKQKVQQEEIFRKMRVTEEELRQYYNGHKEQFTTPEYVTLRELFIAAPSLPGTDVRPEDNAAAKARIDAIRARAVAGEDFVELVKSQSDAATKATGGLIGPLNLEDINPIVKDVVAGLKVGEISQPLAMPRGGYEIFKMDARATPELQAFEKVKPEIEQRIRESRLDVETDKLLGRLRAQAVIEWKDDGYKELYEKRLAQGPSVLR
jgi:parvulin-like peptidyl-prolyl isomerase